MSANIGGAKRHQRQRSSVTIKKRASLNRLNGDLNTVDVPDNSLSPPPTGYAALTDPNEIGTNGTSNSNSSSPSLGIRTHSRGPSFNPVHGKHISPLEADEEENGVKAKRIDEQPDYFNFHSPSNQRTADVVAVDMNGLESALAEQETTNDMHVADMTTRSELDLFDDEDSLTDLPRSRDGAKASSSEAKETSNFASVSPLPAREVDVPRQADSQDAQLLANPSVSTPTQGDINGGSVFGTPTSSVKGRKDLSLLIGASNVPSSSPSTSPIAVRTSGGQGPPSASLSNTTPRSARKTKRMSLGYFAASGNSSRPGTAGNTVYNPPPMTPPVSSSSTSSVPGSRTTPGGPRSASISTNASIESSVGKAPTDEGETIVTQHKGILERIAEKERGIFELKETLAREEAELKMLQREWQTTVAREMTIDKGGLSTKARPAAAAQRSTGRSDGDTTAKEKQDYLSTTQTGSSSGGVAAADALKGLSAKFQNGFGNQINAFLDQLVSLPPEENEEAGKELPSTHPIQQGQEPAKSEQRSSLGSVIEEDEGWQKKKTISAQPVPDQPTNKTTQITPKQHSKRTSMFGASFAAFQKQMEHQLGVASSSSSSGKDPNKGPEPSQDRSQDSSANESGWGAWQKRLKEARDNASGFLAMAEAKIGQAMTIDDLIEAGERPSDAQLANRPPPPSAFTTENDREKAALAELSWLNSLAGIKMSGTVDRVITSNASPNPDASRLSRSTSPASSQSTTRATQARSPPLSSGTAAAKLKADGNVDGQRHNRRRSSVKESDGKPTGIFDVLSAVWSPTLSTSDDLSPTTMKDKRLSGQSRTRQAARAAVNQESRRSPTSTRGPQSDEADVTSWNESFGERSTAGIGLFGLDEDEEKSHSKPQSDRKHIPSGEVNLPDQAEQDSVKREKEKEDSWAW